MKNEHKFCPFKKYVEMGYNNGRRTMKERFEKCAAEKCMAFKNGNCLRLQNARKADLES